MREGFHGQLTAIRGALGDMTDTAATAMERATVALLGADLTVAEGVSGLATQLDAARRVVEDQTYEVLALQQPVASDLRTMVMAIKVGGDIHRMGTLAQHVAKVAVRRHPGFAVPDELFPLIRKMGDVAVRMAQSAGAVLHSTDAADAGRLSIDDDAMDGLRRALFRTLLDNWSYGVESAIDMALLGRYYERFADHAVAIADGVVYLVTGEMPREPDEKLS
ncbi:phosphate signaling complex protein PhoU [Cryptosporangium japonicum]|uniref:Phosphate-specific transport system accessory protein PhoU n=1 Tax=Cryptosporangium japonicum TaxID=80872 RepID=A0ABN0TVB4_9ACTN